MDSRKLKQLENAVKSIKKEYGSGVIAEDSANGNVPRVNSGCLNLDVALGIGGFARSRIHEIFGSSDSGKTSICLLTIAEVQRNGGIAAFINADGLLDANWASLLGVNMNDLILVQPDTGETTFNVSERLISSGALDVIVIDSVAAMVPKAELEGEFGEGDRDWLHSKMMSSGLRRLNSAVKTSNTACIFTNQTRMKFGVGGANAREDSTGGNALKFYVTQRLSTHCIEPMKNGDNIVGAKVGATLVKSKVSKPYTKAELVFNMCGFDRIHDVVHTSTYSGIIKKMGNDYLYKDQKLGKSLKEVYIFLSKHHDQLEEISRISREYHKIADKPKESDGSLQLTG